MAILTEGYNASDFLKFESGEATLFSRENVIVLSGQVLIGGEIIGKTNVGAATSAVKASGANTGNGILTLDPTTPVLANAQVGVYTARATVVGTNSATFRVYDPTGDSLGDFSFSGAAAVGSFADQIKFTITDGTAADFVVGDGFDITVAAGAGKVKALAVAGTDGTQVAVGIMLFPVDATAGDVKGVAVVRDVVVADNRIKWPVGITAPQKAAAIQQLLAKNIIIRMGV